MTTKADTDPCLKCGTPVNNRTQICRPCRSIHCVKCGDIFTPVKVGVDKCSPCKYGHKRKAKPAPEKEVRP